MGTCTRCFEEKKIYCTATIKKYNQSELVAALCEDCFHGKCICVICLDKTNYTDYESHIMQKHSKEEMAKYLLHEKMSSDIM
jgi:hypothetical protein